LLALSRLSTFKSQTPISLNHPSSLSVLSRMNTSSKSCPGGKRARLSISTCLLGTKDIADGLGARTDIRPAYLISRFDGKRKDETGRTR
jgi:hypothetical protein